MDSFAQSKKNPRRRQEEAVGLAGRRQGEQARVRAGPNRQECDVNWYLPDGHSQIIGPLFLSFLFSVFKKGSRDSVRDMGVPRETPCAETQITAEVCKVQRQVNPGSGLSGLRPPRRKNPRFRPSCILYVTCTPHAGGIGAHGISPCAAATATSRRRVMGFPTSTRLDSSPPR